MSKNIIIQEGGTPYQFTAKKLKTDKVGGGTCLWVPEEETILTKKKITEEGTYKASDEGYYGYSEVEVDVTGSGAFKTKRITQNGTYKAEDDGLVGYSKVKVNVRGGNGSADSAGKPRITYDSDGNMEDGPGGIGSSITGWDEVDGNQYAIGVDSNGNLVKTKIPSGIEVATPPTKTSYNFGESIDYSGIIVILKGGDSALFSNADYPNGRIPFSQLSFPVTTAPAPTGTGGRISQLPTNWQQPIITYGMMKFTMAPGYPAQETTITGNILIMVNNERAAWVLVSSSPGIIGHIRVVDVASQNVVREGGITADYSVGPIGGKLAYRSTFQGNNYDHAYNCDPLVNEHRPEPDDNTIWTAVYGAVDGGTADIPVRWTSPYDGRTFEDKFEIEVTGGGSGSGSTDGGGYSDDSGGSSSGGGGGF